MYASHVLDVLTAWPCYNHTGQRATLLSSWHIHTTPGCPHHQDAWSAFAGEGLALYCTLQIKPLNALHSIFTRPVLRTLHVALHLILSSARHTQHTTHCTSRITQCTACCISHSSLHHTAHSIAIQPQALHSLNFALHSALHTLLYTLLCCTLYCTAPRAVTQEESLPIFPCSQSFKK